MRCLMRNPHRGTTDLEQFNLLILRLHLIEKLLGRLERRDLSDRRQHPWHEVIMRFDKEVLCDQLGGTQPFQREER